MNTRRYIAFLGLTFLTGSFFNARSGWAQAPASQPTRPSFFARSRLAHAPTSQPAKIEDGSAKAGLRDFFAAVRSGDTTQVLPLWDCTNTEEADLAGLATKSMIAAAKLETAIRTKFGSATTKPTVTLLPDEVEIAAATEGPADKKIHHIYGVDASDAHWNYAMIKTKAGWKVSMAGTLEPFPLVPTKAWKKMFTASAADSVTADVESGKLKSADEAKTAFQRLTEKAAKDAISPTTQKD